MAGTPSIVQRPTLQQLNLSTGKQARLYRLLYRSGPANGTLLLLPYDHGVEHGPVDFMDNPDSADPVYLFQLAIEGNFSGIVTHMGIAQRYYADFAGQIPLIVKLNGKTNIPPDDEAFSPLTGTVEEAARVGADAVGYTLFVGSPSQDRDMQQLAAVRKETERLGLPLIVWSYPRGKPVEEKAGRDSLYAVDYAARMALEMGADIVKINLPKVHKENSKPPDVYRELEADRAEMTRRVVSSAKRCLVLFSGGSYKDDEALLADIDMGMRAGAVGIIAGRNMWQRPHDDALSMVKRTHELLRRYEAPPL